MSTFTVGGLVSGLDTDNIITQLMAIERRPLTRSQQREEITKAKLSLYQELNTKLSALKSSASTVGQESTLQSVTATSSDTDTLTVTASTSPNQGTFTVSNITSIASQNAFRSNTTFASSTTDIVTTAGTFDIEIGGSVAATVTYDADDSLTSIRDRINDANVDAQASIVDFSGTGTDYRLIVTAKKEGTTNEVTLTNDTGSLLATDLGGLTETQTASDASFTFAGVAVTRSTNTITDLIEGVTLQLKATTAGSVNITLASDATKNQANIDSFITSVNDVIGWLDGQLKYDSTKTKQGILFGDSTLQTIRQDLMSTLTTTAGTGSITTLAILGITTSSTSGQFSGDGTLATQLANNSAAVQDFFEALGESLTNVSASGLIDSFLATGGPTSIRINGFNSDIVAFDEEQTKLEARLERKEEQLRKQFARMEQVLSQLQTQSQYMLAQLGSLQTSSSSKK